MKLMEDHDENEVTREDFDKLKEQYYHYADYMNTFKGFLQYVQSDAEYINLNGYKNDEKLKKDIRNIIKEFDF